MISPLVKGGIFNILRELANWFAFMAVGVMFIFSDLLVISIQFLDSS